MPKRANPYLTDEDNPPLTAKMIKGMRPAREVFAELGIRYPGQRGPQKAPTKEQVTLRLDRDVLKKLRADGAGWQTRANEILRSAVFQRNARPCASSSAARRTRRATRQA
jgi:uncharacterized protein (DUF4415 family)